jgi:hypothetical protein
MDMRGQHIIASGAMVNQHCRKRYAAMADATLTAF